MLNGMEGCDDHIAACNVGPSDDVLVLGMTTFPDLGRFARSVAEARTGKQINRVLDGKDVFSRVLVGRDVELDDQFCKKIWSVVAPGGLACFFFNPTAQVSLGRRDLMQRTLDSEPVAQAWWLNTTEGELVVVARDWDRVDQR